MARLADSSRIEASSIPEPMSGCWLWLGATTPNQRGMIYGVLSAGGKRVRAHRYSYEAYKGPIPAGMFVCHRCDNPSCVNPDHLFVGTNQDNVDDCCRKNRKKPVLGERNGRATISNETAAHIKWMMLLGFSQGVIAAEFGVSERTVEDMSAGKSWRGIQPKTPRHLFSNTTDPG